MNAGLAHAGIGVQKQAFSGLVEQHLRRALQPLIGRKVSRPEVVSRIAAALAPPRFRVVEARIDGGTLHARYEVDYADNAFIINGVLGR